MMKKILIIILISYLLFSCSEQDVVFETSGFRISIDDKGNLSSIIEKKSGKNFLYSDSVSPLLSIRKNQKFIYSESMSVDDEQQNIMFTFPGKILVTININENIDYLKFELISVDNPEGIDLVVWGPFCTGINNVIGETIGVVQDNEFAVGLQALNPKTLGGYPWNENDCLPQLDIFEGDDFSDISEKNKRHVLYRVEAAKPTEFGSSLQAYCRNRNKERIVENWGHQKYITPAFDDGGIIGSKIALFGCSRDDILSTISKIELNEGLPHPLIQGEWGKISREASSAYLILDFSESDIEKAVEITRLAGLKYMYHSAPFESWGHFPLKKNFFPNGWDGMKKCVDYAARHGISIGVHTLSNFITTNDAYVSPVPDKRLAFSGKTALTNAIDEKTTDIQIKSSDFFNKTDKSHLKTIRIGNELIRYSGISESEPWILSDCQRGQFGTQAANHDQNSEIFELADHGYKVFLSNPELTFEIAENIARLFNNTGLRQISFDGLEGCRSTGMGNYGEILMTTTWYKNLSDDIKQHFIADASRTSHFFWHIYSRMNWGEPWYDNFRESQQEYRLKNQKYFKRNFMPGMLGWFLMRPSTSVEDIEWLLARSAGFDAGYAFVMSYDAVEQNGLSSEILSLLGQWEKLRMNNSIPDSLKILMQDVNNEFELHNKNKIIQIDSRKYTYSKRIRQPGEPTYTTFQVTGYDDDALLSFIISADGCQASNITIEVDDYKSIQIPAVIGTNQKLKYSDDNEVQLFDENWNHLRSIKIVDQEIRIKKGDQNINFACDISENKGKMKIEFRTDKKTWMID